MPSPHHQALVDLCSSDPALIARLLADAFHITAPTNPPEPDESTFRLPSSVDLHADLVLRANESDDPRTPNVIVEVQLGPDPDKEWSWPLYLAFLRWRHRRDALVAVLAPDEAVAEWARKLIRLGPGRSTVEVFVLGPAQIPRIETLEAARRQPELAALSALTHASEPGGIEIAKCASLAVAESAMRAEIATLVYNSIAARLDDAGRDTLEAFMETVALAFQGEYINKHELRGMAMGVAKGKAEGKAEAVLRIVVRKGMRLSTEQESLIRSCQDEARLDTWLDRAIAATNAGDLFDA